MANTHLVIIAVTENITITEKFYGARNLLTFLALNSECTEINITLLGLALILFTTLEILWHSYIL
jgi:hypothetical protein